MPGAVFKKESRFGCYAKWGRARARPRSVSVFFGQQEGGHAAVGFGDDPQRIFAPALGRLGRVNRIGRQDAKPGKERLEVALAVFGADNAPITAHMPRQTLQHVIVATGGDCATGSDYLTEFKQSCWNADRLFVVGCPVFGVSHGLISLLFQSLDCDM